MTYLGRGIRFLADDLVLYLQTHQREKALEALFGIIRSVMEALEHSARR